MKKIFVLILLVLSACESQQQRPQGADRPSPEGCAALISEVPSLSGLETQEFLKQMTLVLEKNATQCSPENAAAVLDERFILECGDLCLIKGREL